MKTENQNKKLLVFGASGSIGQHLVNQALELGYQVSAFVRDPSKMNIQHDKLRTLKGDAMDYESVEKSISGHDAVLIAIGAGRQGKVRAESTKNIIRAMKKAGNRRLICQSTLGVGDSWNTLTFFWKYVMFKGIIRKAFHDHEMQEDWVKQSDLDWTIVRPSAFKDGEKTGKYMHGFSRLHKKAKLSISRADVADFMLKQLDEETYLRKAPGISN